MRVKPGCAAATQGEPSAQTSRVRRRACLKMAVSLRQLRLACVPSRTRYPLVAGGRAAPLTFERASNPRARSDSRFTLPSRLLYGVKMRHGGDVKYAVGRRRRGTDGITKFGGTEQLLLFAC